MASPLGHAMVGLTAATVVAKATGAPHTVALWLGSLVASGAPDLDLGLAALGLRGPRYHRNGSHSLVSLGGVLLLGWGALVVFPGALDWRVALAWSVALLTHPVLDVATTGPSLANRGYGVGLFWPIQRKRWFLSRPVFEQSVNWGACPNVRCVWEGIVPELRYLAPACVAVVVLAILL